MRALWSDRHTIALITCVENLNVSGLLVRPFGIEWKTSRKPKMGKSGRRKENGPWPKMVKEWKITPQFSPGLGQLVAHVVSGLGPFSVFFPPFSAFGPFSTPCQACDLNI